MAGYNYQIGNVILGIQGEYNYADIAGSEVNIFTNIHTARLRNFGSVDGRLGLAFLGNTMLYCIGGVAFGDIKQKFSDPPVRHQPPTREAVGTWVPVSKLPLGTAGPAGSDLPSFFGPRLA